MVAACFNKINYAHKLMIKAHKCNRVIAFGFKGGKRKVNYAIHFQNFATI